MYGDSAYGGSSMVGISHLKASSNISDVQSLSVFEAMAIWCRKLLVSVKLVVANARASYVACSLYWGKQKVELESTLRPTFRIRTSKIRRL